MASAQKSRDLAFQDDVSSQMLWRQAMALVAGRAGRLDEARRMIGEASALAERTDGLYARGMVARDAGRIEQWRGDLDAARRQYSMALGLFEQKGDVVDAARVRDALQEISRTAGG